MTEYKIAQKHWLTRAHLDGDHTAPPSFVWIINERYGSKPTRIELMREIIGGLENEDTSQWSEKALKRRWPIYSREHGIKIVKVKNNNL